MLVALDFPENLQIAFADRPDRVNLAPVNEGGPVAGERVEMPVNGMAEIEIGEAEQIEPSRDGLLGARYDRVALAGKASVDRLDNHHALGGGVRKEPTSRPQTISQLLSRAFARAVTRSHRELAVEGFVTHLARAGDEETVGQLDELLPPAADHLAQTHTSEPIQFCQIEVHIPSDSTKSLADVFLIAQSRLCSVRSG